MKRYPCDAHGCTATVPERGLCPWHVINGTPDEIIDLKHLRSKTKAATK